MIDVLSYGGGVQSVATVVLILQGRIIKPDLIVMADTGREKRSTFSYLEKYIAPLINVEILKAKEFLNKNDYSSITHYSTGNIDTKLPMFLDSSGKLKPHCSDRWKRTVINRYLRNTLKIKECRIWLGFTTDELKRVKNKSDKKWCEYAYPLIDKLFKQGISDLSLSRQACIQIIEDFGLPCPPKSSCFICPHMKQQEWLDLPSDEIKKASEIEKEIQEATADTLDHTPYLTRICKPLPEAIREMRESQEQDNQQLQLFGSCDSGFCFV